MLARRYCIVRDGRDGVLRGEYCTGCAAYRTCDGGDVRRDLHNSHLETRHLGRYTQQSQDASDAEGAEYDIVPGTRNINSHRSVASGEARFGTHHPTSESTTSSKEQ